MIRRKFQKFVLFLLCPNQDVEIEGIFMRLRAYDLIRRIRLGGGLTNRNHQFRIEAVTERGKNKE